MSDEYIEKVNRDRNKSFEHLTDTLENFIYQKGIIDGYEIKTSSDFDYNKATDRLTITINMSRDI